MDATDYINELPSKKQCEPIYRIRGPPGRGVPGFRSRSKISTSPASSGSSLRFLRAAVTPVRPAQAGAAHLTTVRTASSPTAGRSRRIAIRSFQRGAGWESKAEPSYLWGPLPVSTYPD